MRCTAIIVTSATFVFRVTKISTIKTIQPSDWIALFPNSWGFLGLIESLRLISDVIRHCCRGNSS